MQTSHVIGAAQRSYYLVNCLLSTVIVMTYNYHLLDHLIES